MQARFDVTLDLILLGLGRGRDCDAAIVEPAGRTLLGQKWVQGARQWIAAVEMTWVGEGFRDIEGDHET